MEVRQSVLPPWINIHTNDCVTYEHMYKTQNTMRVVDIVTVSGDECLTVFQALHVFSRICFGINGVISLH